MTKEEIENAYNVLKGVFYEFGKNHNSDVSKDVINSIECLTSYIKQLEGEVDKLRKDLHESFQGYLLELLDRKDKEIEDLRRNLVRAHEQTVTL